MNWPAKGEPQILIPRIVAPAFENRTETSLRLAGSDWLCAWCLNGVANESARFLYEGQDEFSFTNPDGVRFEIITFKQTLGCHPTGLPTLNHTWFAGHAWSFCHCDQCGVHLGWFYCGQHDFAGLIKARMVHSMTLRN